MVCTYCNVRLRWDPDLRCYVGAVSGSPVCRRATAGRAHVPVDFR
jgi:hypothetical protein